MKKIIISEEQYLRLFLNEQVFSPVSYSAIQGKSPAVKKRCNKNNRNYEYTDIDFKYERFMVKLQSSKMVKVRGLDKSDWFCKNPCSTTVTGSIDGDIEKGVLCINRDLYYHKQFCCPESIKSVIAKEYGISGESFEAEKEIIWYQTSRLPFIAVETPWYEDDHVLIDIAAIAALLIPIAGPFISAGLEGINAALYFKEGEELMGALSLGLMVIPGAFILRRALSSTILKYIDEVTIWLIKSQKSNTPITKKILNNKLKKVMGEKLFNANKKWIDNYFSKVLPQIGKSSGREIGKKLSYAIKRSKGDWKRFTDDKVFKKYMDVNDNIYTAYLAYLKSNATKEFLITAGLYTLIMNFGAELITFAMEKNPKLKEKVVAARKYIDTIETPFAVTLADDAAKGNISSIVKLAGYDWDSTKEIFMSDSKENDNNLLKQAWESGWRPYDKETKIHNNVPEKYMTSRHKEYIEVISEILKAPDNPLLLDLPSEDEITM